MSFTPSSVIEHVVLFKVKPETDSTKVASMVNGLNALTSLPQVLHLTAGPVHKNRSSAFSFTHMLHSRYTSKSDLSDYSAHPDHLSVVRESVLPICEDIMAVDWVNSAPAPSPLIAPGSALRLSFLKLKPEVAEGNGIVIEDIISVLKGVKDHFGSVEQISVGENFSPARAKGFSIASLGIFKGVGDLDETDSKLEFIESQKEKLRGYLDGVVVLDYVIPQSANL